ncbi:MAG TPA: nucleotide exchange factor GrpE [Bacillota bacterium]|nr:nucleotide exchange factor GrpE [Bacillota bacterium]
MSSPEDLKEDVTEAAGSQAAQPEGNQAPAGEPTYEELADQLKAQKALAEENFNRLQRLQADFENYKRRTLKERQDLLNYGSEGMVCALLPVLDNLERAVQAQGGEEGLLKGVEMICEQFHEALKSQGVSKICAVGEQFDPNLHQAVMRLPSSEHPDNHVVEEFQTGYQLKDRVIRPSMVKVAVTE